MGRAFRTSPSYAAHPSMRSGLLRRCYNPSRRGATKWNYLESVFNIFVISLPSHSIVSIVFDLVKSFQNCTFEVSFFSYSGNCPLEKFFFNLLPCMVRDSVIIKPSLQCSVKLWKFWKKCFVWNIYPFKFFPNFYFVYILDYNSVANLFFQTFCIN